MSLENVRDFYERLATDDDFRNQIQGVESRELGRQILQDSGYNFSPEEFEEYTEQLLESSNSDDSLRVLSEQEAEAVIGGFFPIFPILLYGVVISQIKYIL
ncbi:Nif11-like leader peptide family natural product precursor [Anabaena cylindrica FACHB-243]|uniref:Bacteriocin propeptide, TIGR03798 family n=1 Tax=Anabaena cylindrica (strain ATCC 27899 / PCC 7122) TaxID=272123 RepID=K9ZL16_ANACC|nr:MULTISPECIES: Nif11-like leader peptide family natural product precursor [Anabaena]AFZ59474.1 bacteriocin propeptide, TIGR03798 family [Anabaena cylindrica PCC 7122]MBD2417629.1 Nif11-like leader peptide family natural product precursor [Anabaena cylindrica FACHB-243]MBY5283253.1 Nif11-like leader peptide family natural product precursor [Anabaena sp. CCAP 1446/1C]MBY5310629.1 Nif11-like leader peptide family natural product precursor [Anabaena sp. CCAP 1446/1C]MCM2405390.1 Nif11-like leade